MQTLPKLGDLLTHVDLQTATNASKPTFSSNHLRNMINHMEGHNACFSNATD